jgi:hypothetical protein
MALLRDAKTETFGCCKNCELTVFNGRDYINSNNDKCVRKTNSKFQNLLGLVHCKGKIWEEVWLYS